MYAYTQANRLTAVSGTDLSWSAVYNGEGARLKQVANGTPTTYTLDLAAPLVTALTERTDATTKQYLYGLGDSPLAVYSGTTWTYLSGRDGLNSVRQETDAAGNVLAARSFDPYGVPLPAEGGGGSPFGYTGEVWDNATQLAFLRARYYVPGTGRFTQRDVWEGNEQQPQSLNSYAYVGNSPINRTDPTGQYWYDPIYDRWVYGGVHYLQAPLHPKIEFYASTSPYREREYVFNWIMPRAQQIESRASQYGIPPELVAEILAVEIDDDTELFDDRTDPVARMCYAILAPIKHGVSVDPGIPCMCAAYLQAYSALGVGIGVPQIHVNRPDLDWWAVVQHFQEGQLPDWVHDPVEKLLTDEGAIEGVAIFSRALADVRTGVNAPHGRGNLTLDDMAIVFVGYRYGVGGFTDAPGSYAFHDVLAFRTASRDALPTTPKDAQRDFDIAKPYADAFQFYFEYIDLYDAEYGR